MAGSYFCILILCIISLLLIMASSLIMMVKYKGTDWDRKIWIGSKILTLEDIIKENNNILKPILNISSNGIITYYKDNYETLLKHSKKECEKNYKPCGILDTLGNIMCIPEDDKCPINDIVVDLDMNKDNYTNKGYSVGHLDNLGENISIYYRNTETQNKIVVKLNVTTNTPKYIFEGNFIFDIDTYEDYNPPQSDDDDYTYPDHDWGWDDDDDYHYKINPKKKLRKLIANDEYGDEEITSYILKRFNEEINVDKTFTKIYDNLFAGNYIGFKDSSHIKDFLDFELYDLYFIVFPNKAATVFCYFCVIIYFFYIVLIIVISRDKEVNNDKASHGALCCFTSVPHLVFFIGFFIYFLYEYSKIYKGRRPFDLTKVKADPFIEDLLKEIQDRHTEENLILAIIIMYSCSAGILIIAGIIGCRTSASDSTFYGSSTLSNTAQEKLT